MFEKCFPPPAKEELPVLLISVEWFDPCGLSARISAWNFYIHTFKFLESNTKYKCKYKLSKPQLNHNTTPKQPNTIQQKLGLT